MELFYWIILVLLTIFSVLDLFLWEGKHAIVSISLVVVFIVYRLYVSSKIIRERKNNKSIPEINLLIQRINELRSEYLLTSILGLSKYFFLTINALINRDVKKLKQTEIDYKIFHLQNEEQLKNIQSNLKQQKNISLEYKRVFNQCSENIIKAKKEMKSVIKLTLRNMETDSLGAQIQTNDLNQLCEEFTQYLNFEIHYVRSSKNTVRTPLDSLFEELKTTIDKHRRKIVKQLKKDDITSKESLFYLTLLSGTENILYYINTSLQIGNYTDN